MSVAGDQRFAPPQAHVADLAPDTPALAGRGSRLLATLVDALLAGLVSWGLVQVPMLQSLFHAAPDRDASLWAWNPMSLALGVPIFLLIQAWPLVTRGQTVGKMLLKLRIVRTDGSHADAWRLLGLRYGIGMLTGVNTGIAMAYGLIDALLIFRTSRQCLHDTIADTKVIKL